MTNSTKTVKTFEDYQHLTEEQKEFYHFQQLNKIDMVHDTMIEMHSQLDEKYAAKKVEYIVYGFVGLILIAFAGALIAGIIPG